METPVDLKYSKDHEWVKAESETTYRIGISDYAQDALGDIVFVDLPEVGQQVKSGDAISEVESTKSVSDVYAPVTGEVVEANSELADQPEKLNSDPYGEGWICVIKADSSEEVSSLLDSEAYLKLTEA